MSSAGSEEKKLLQRAEALLTQANLKKEDVVKIVVSLTQNMPALGVFEFLLEGDTAVDKLRGWAGETVLNIYSLSA
jgi:hypothetical protein